MGNILVSNLSTALTVLRLPFLTDIVQAYNVCLMRVIFYKTTIGKVHVVVNKVFEKFSPEFYF